MIKINIQGISVTTKLFNNYALVIDFKNTDITLYYRTGVISFLSGTSDNHLGGKLGERS